MTRLPDHLNEAAPADNAGLDLPTLHERAARRRRRRQGRVAGAAALVVVGIAVVGVAGAWSSPDEAVTAAQGGDGEVALDPAVDPSTTDPVDVPPTEPSVSVPETTEVPPPPTSEPVEPRTEPVAPTTEAVPSGPRSLELRGTYEAEEHHVAGTSACPDLTHTLDMNLTMEDGSAWVGREDYCGTHVGLRWNGEGTFTLTAPDGSALAGTFTSTAPMGSSGVPYSLDVREGSGTYAGATGRCDLSIHITPLASSRQAQRGTIACTLSIP